MGYKKYQQHSGESATIIIGFDFTSILASLNVADRDTFYKAPPLVANFHVEQCGRYRVS